MRRYELGKNKRIYGKFQEAKKFLTKIMTSCIFLMTATVDLDQIDVPGPLSFQGGTKMSSFVGCTLVPGGAAIHFVGVDACSEMCIGYVET